MTDTKTDREAFENWCLNHHYSIEQEMISGVPLYSQMETRKVWYAWQAAIEHARKPVSLHEWQEAIRKAVWEHGLNGINAAKSVLDTVGVKYE